MDVFFIFYLFLLHCRNSSGNTKYNHAQKVLISTLNDSFHLKGIFIITIKKIYISETPFRNVRFWLGYKK